MTTPQWARVKDLFQAALDQPLPDRRRRLREWCGADLALLARVESLLTAHDEAGSFAERPMASLMSALAPGIDVEREPAHRGEPVLRVSDRLGAYEIQSLIGAGGMGEVYRALDTRLRRIVAIKVLHTARSADPAAHERLEREARAVAALNHQHICTLYDVGRQDGIDYLVMEHLSGETLAARLAKGPLSVEQGLELAIQIASALDAAHRAGIIHRDLKPGNILLTRSGGPAAATVAKLLDFGLAKVYQPVVEAVSAVPPGSSELTKSGAVAGTLRYMAPEQLEGRPTDARTDIFAFGAVIYEAIGGRQAFDGATDDEVVAAILESGPPPLADVRTATPATLNWIVTTCLARNPADRWQTARDLHRALVWSRDTNTPSRPPTASAARSRLRERAAWSLCALLLAIGAAAVFLFTDRSAAVPPVAPKRFVVTLPDLRPFVPDGRTFSFVPDGSGIVYLSVTPEGSSRIHLYTLSDGVSRALAGTEQALHPTVSPDGRWVAFYRSNRLMKVAIAGGPPVEIGAVPYLFGVSWSADDSIVFAAGSGLQRIPAGGGDAQALTTLQPGEFRHVSPHVLPDGTAVLFTALRRSGTMEDVDICVVRIATRERRTLLKGAGDAQYSSSGHLLYVRQADLLGVSFDPKRLQVSGTPFLAAASIQIKPQELVGSFDIAGDGTLAWIASSASDLQRRLVWIDRKGEETALPIPVRPYSHPALMPDERSAIVEIEATPHNLWHLDLASGALTRLTREGANHRPVVSWDGRSFVFSSDRTTPRSLFRQSTDGGGAPERLVDAAWAQNVTSWSADGRWLAFTQATPTTRDDIWVLAMHAGSTPRPFLQTASSEQQATFSPDGRWIAYSSDESGRQEVMIQSFPGDGPRKQVSTSGGETPSFSRDGKTVFYRVRDRLWAVPISTDPVLTIGRPSIAFELSGVLGFTGLPNYVVNRAGDRVLAAKTQIEPTHAQAIQVMVNWQEERQRRVSAR
jgi:serine/threonine protein kinase/Tol biopolymer transport system component